MWTHFYEQVHVVWHYLQLEHLGFPLGGNLSNKLVQKFGSAVDKHGLSVLGTPVDVILTGIYYVVV